MARLFFTMQLSLEALLEQYQAIQQLLLVKLQGKRFSHVQPFWADSQASYYNKRGGRRPFTFNNVIDLLRGLHMEDELAVVFTTGGLPGVYLEAAPGDASRYD